jgi:hypothetical protein
MRLQAQGTRGGAGDEGEMHKHGTISQCLNNTQGVLNPLTGVGAAVGLAVGLGVGACSTHAHEHHNSVVI